MASLRALTVAQVHRLLALTALPLTALLDNNMDSTSRHTAAEHHRVNTVASNLRMLLRVTNMISTASISTTSTVVHQTTASLNKTRSTPLTSLVREAVTDSNLAVNLRMADHHREEHLMVDLNMGNRLMADRVRTSSHSISTISTAEHRSSWASTRHRMEVMEGRAATTEDHPLQHGDKLERNRDGHACSLDESWVRMHSVRSEDQ
jgi:hypothetical protein